ncbi:hypothetical protein Daus18300_014260 [Diaporthe australafricana]|uniref:Uncharacterized protein n=1 Tax=Diaporthe australafricana TaxID=127596 RepID=A0ABR3VVY6_9PEZI
MAIDSPNTEALVELLDRGWRVNGSWRSFFDTPLQYALKRANYYEDYDDSKIDGLIEMHGMVVPPALQGPHLETHTDIYKRYTGVRRSQAAELYRRKLAEATTILCERGGRVSPFSSIAGTTSAAGRAVRPWAIILHTLLYAVALPLVLVYATRGIWHDMSVGQKFGFAYLWTLLSYFVPHCSMFDNKEVSSFVHIVPKPSPNECFIRALYFIAFLFNHVGLPYIVVRHGWRPIRSCDYFVENAVIEAIAMLLIFFFTA